MDASKLSASISKRLSLEHASLRVLSLGEGLFYQSNLIPADAYDSLQ